MVGQGAAESLRVALKQILAASLASSVEIDFDRVPTARSLHVRDQGREKHVVPLLDLRDGGLRGAQLGGQLSLTQPGPFADLAQE